MTITLTITLCINGTEIEADSMFNVAYIMPDRSVGDPGGWWAELMHVQLGGLQMTRVQVLDMLCRAEVEAIEERASEAVTANSGPYVNEDHWRDVG